jgi:hypothetical protein
MYSVFQTYSLLNSAGTVYGEPLQGPEAGHRPSIRVELGLDCQVEKLIVSSVEELGVHAESRHCIIYTGNSWGKGGGGATTLLTTHVPF